MSLEKTLLEHEVKEDKINLDKVDFFLKAKPEVTNSVLYNVCGSLNPELIKIFIKHGFKFNKTYLDFQSWEPLLHCSVKKRRETIYECFKLLSPGIDSSDFERRIEKRLKSLNRLEKFLKQTERRLKK